MAAQRPMFSLGRPPTEPPAGPATAVAVDMALDTVGAILRMMGESALELPDMEPAAFIALCEQWAQHVLLAGPVPGTNTPPADGRRDWSAVRTFARSYFRNSATHSRAITADLRQVVWVFIQTFSHAFAQAEDADSRIRTQLERLEELARGAAPSELKREVMSAVVAVTQVVDERRKRQQQQMETLGAQVKTLGHELETARKESEVDPLTRLYNRKAFDAYVARSVELFRAFAHPTCLLLIDVDNFKRVNDALGHTAGDALLCKLADALSRTFLRKSDFVARYGGDEMAVVLRETALPDARTLADRCLRAVRNVGIAREGLEIRGTVSIGVAALTPDDDAKTWIDRADEALYAAKEAGRDRVVTADDV